MRRFAATILFIVFSVLLAGGCTQSRTVTITATPPDAIIRINGLDRGRGPITHTFVFNNAGTDIHRVNVHRIGYRDYNDTVTVNRAPRNLNVKLDPLKRTVRFSVLPVPAIVSINGEPVSTEPVSSWQAELDLSVNNRNEWKSYTVKAERKNYAPATVTVNWRDNTQSYDLRLEPLRKNLSITTEPSGASVYLDGELIGASPHNDLARAFPVDPDTDEFIPRQLRITRPGYDPIETEISWDDGKNDYHVSLDPKTKIVRIITDPPDADVLIENMALRRDSRGVAITELRFLPINDQTGELREYQGVASKRSDDGEWEPAKFKIAWDNGQSEYTVRLKEILTRPMSLLTAVWTRDNAWEILPREIETIYSKDLTEGSDRAAPQPLTRLREGSIDTLAVSPDGQRVLFTVLRGKDKNDFHSQLYVIRTDGEGGADLFSDGKSLDLYPTYTPGGDQIVFASNRAGMRLSIWQMSASGAPGITRLTSGETNDAWPAVDSEPQPRLYYQSMLNNRTDPRLFRTVKDTMFLTDLQMTGMQPRVSPKNDVIVFTAINDKTGKRDIFKMPAGGGTPQNLTATPDVDEFDAVWNFDGSKIAFASDQTSDDGERPNVNIWMLDLNKPDGPKQVTFNASQDDNPAWDPAGNSLYFRSNRGGEWGIWKIAAP